MITKEHAVKLEAAAWPYKLDVGWAFEEYYYPKDRHLRTVFKIGRKQVHADVVEEESNRNVYTVSVVYPQFNGTDGKLKTVITDLDDVHRVVSEFLKQADKLLNENISDYKQRQIDALELARSIFGDGLYYGLYTQKTAYPIRVQICLEENIKDLRNRTAEYCVYEDHSTMIVLVPYLNADDYETNLIKEVLKYRALKHKLSTT